MECFTINLIFLIIFAPIVYGFSVPTVNVKLLKPKGIQFSIQEKRDVFNDVRIFVFASKSLINNLKFVESELKRDVNGLWTYETTNVDLTADDSIEYWMYVECNKLGRYVTNVIKVADIDQQQSNQKLNPRSIVITPTVNNTYPQINVKRSKTGNIRFYIQDEQHENGPLTNVKLIIFASKPIANNSKLIEVPLVKNNDNGVWSYELKNTPLTVDDEIEYWLSTEMYGLGYFSNNIIKLRDLEIDDGKWQKRQFVAEGIFNETFPIVNVEMVGNNGLVISLQEEYDEFNDVRITIFSPKILVNNDLQYTENQLKRDDSGLWIYEMRNIALKNDDIFEYWIYVEKPNVGYFASQKFRVQDIAPSSPVEQLPPSPEQLKISTTTPMPSTCEASVSTVNGKSVACRNSIIFNEDFNLDNLRYWSFDTRFPLDDATADAEFCIYEKRAETSFIRDGSMTLKAESLKKIAGFDDARIRIGSYNLKERCTPISNDERECSRQAQFGYILPPVTSAYLTTRSKFSFMYGRVEARLRAPIGDYLYAQITLQPQLKPEEAANDSSTSQHLKVFFARGNEQLKDADEEVGGSRVYGGAILSKNPKNNLKWLKSKQFPNTHLGNDFHIYELLWTPTEISLSIDGIKYGSLSSNLRDSAMVAKIKSAVNWANNGPFDREHFLSINLGAGSVKNFYSINNTLVNGAEFEPKPWSDTDPRAERSFYMAHDKWYPTWKKPSLEVDYIKIYSV
ncbi:hypothetical protein PVAND_009239 [Polypedilum vanderplanki]|uniref:Uncharacterized protein n=1 Tax=Polypedilum vanderplanki TaxID=319348 RepID=A0A9J6CDH2_POLVA|nr:hypothetical protein PVAND_009239 [Polypedilum vanderplanki]